MLAFISQAAWSAQEASTPFPLNGRAQASGTISNYGILGGDGMLPVYGNRNGFVFGDLMAGYGANDSYVVSPGGGYRKVFDNHIWGAYLFSDYQRPNTGGNFWDISPGVEWITPRWDAHANAYFPTNQKQQIGSPVFADTVGDYSRVSFSSHNQIDAYVQPYSVMGNGVDAEVGYSLPGINGLRTRVSLGAYYYTAPNVSKSVVSSNSSIKGVSFGVEVPVSKNFSLSVANSYDNVNHNIAALSLNLSLGGNSSTFSHDVHDRLLDTLERHVGIIGSGSGEYAQKEYVYTGANGVEYNNVYFISTTGTDSAATYENPGPLDQTTLDAIQIAQASGGARIYIQGGSAAVYDVNSVTVPSGTSLGVYAGQDLFGRSANYTAPAASDLRPVVSVDGINGYSGFSIQSGEVSFDDLAITASSTNGTTLGISTTNSLTTTVNVLNSSVGSFNTGLYADNSGSGILNINISNSQFNGNTSLGSYGAYGIDAYSATGTLNINTINSSFNGNTANGDNNGGSFGAYISAAYLNLNVTNSNFNGNINSGLNSAAQGLQVVGGTGASVINVSNSEFNGNLVSGVSNGGTYGLAVLGGNGSLNLNVQASQFNNNVANGANNAGAYGLYLSSGSNSPMVVAISSSTFNGNAANGDGNVGAYGLAAYNAPTGSGGYLTLSATDSLFNGNLVSGSGAFAYGFYVNNSDASGSAALSVTSLVGSIFDNNGSYGIYAIGNPLAATTVNIADTDFSGNPINVRNGGDVVFTN